jgi:flagellar motility protein MotE (MotC chaperone)
MIKRLRLVDAVVIAATALLALKGIDYLRRDAAPTVGPSVVHGSDQLPAFARVLAHARSNFTPAEVLMTGSTDEAEIEAVRARGLSASLDALPGAVAPSRSEETILDRLNERRQELQQRNQDMELRERLLEQAEQRLEARLQEMREREEAMGQGAAVAQQAQAGLENLVLMYETMRPKEAARVFDRLGLDVLVPVVLEMNPRKMAEVLAVMSPEAAERLTVALARRAKGAPGAEQVRMNGGGSSNELPAIDLPRRN